VIFFCGELADHNQSPSARANIGNEPIQESDLLSTRCVQRVLLEHPERNGLVVSNDDFTVVRRTSPHRSLRIAEPWADGKPEQLEPFPPNIDAQLFLECEGQARRAMIEHDAIDPKFIFIQERSGRKLD
jgi:hypothetical protein